MPLSVLQFNPGIVKDITEYSAGKNGPFWIDSNLVRFRNGFPAKIGGWEKEQINALDTAGNITSVETNITGIARRMVYWRAFSDGEDRLAVGTDNHLYIIENSSLYDITPLRDETNAASTLSSGVNATADLALVSVAGFSASGSVIIGTEIISYTSISSLTLTNCTRGSNATSAASHNSGVAVTQVLTGSLATTITEDLTDSENAISVASVDGFSTAGTIKIGTEIITYTGISVLELTGCTRGASSTTAATHSSGAAVLKIAVGPIGTISGSKIVTIIDVAHNAKVTDWVVLSGAAAIGGITTDVLNSMAGHQVTKVVNVNTYEITVPSAATSTVVAGGGVAIVIKYLIGVDAGMGSQSSVPALGWGVGGWGGLEGGPGWNVARTENTEGIFLENTSWNLALWGEDLIANVRNGAIYYWDTSAGSSTRAVLVSSVAGANSVPSVSRTSIVSFPDRHFIAGGCQSYATGGGGNVDQMLVRWSNQEDFTNFQPTSTNTAGDQRLQIGTKIVAMVSAREETIISTDEAIYGMTFVGSPFIFSFRLLATDAGAAGLNTMISIDGNVFYMGKRNFFRYDGIVKEMPCPVKHYVFNRMQQRYIDKVAVGHNKSFKEITWFYVSNDVRYEINIGTQSVVDDILSPVLFCGTGFPFPGEPQFNIGDTIWISGDNIQNGIFGLRSKGISFGVSTIIENITASGNLVVRLDPTDSFGTLSTVENVENWKFVRKMITGYAISDVVAPINSVIAGENTGDNPEPDSYITYDYEDNVWSVGSMQRNVWSDSFGARKLPFAFDADGYLYNHETGTTADGSAMNAYIEASPQEIDGSGNDLQLIDKIIPDAILGDNTTLNLHLIAKKYPQSGPDNTVNRGPLAMTSNTTKISTRVKGRQVALKFQSRGLKDEWELGTFRANTRKDGMR